VTSQHFFEKKRVTGESKPELFTLCEIDRERERHKCLGERRVSLAGMVVAAAVVAVEWPA